MVRVIQGLKSSHAGCVCVGDWQSLFLYHDNLSEATLGLPMTAMNKSKRLPPPAEQMQQLCVEL